MNNIKKGDIGFLMHHDNIISKTIAWFMQSKWSHSFIIADVIDDRIYILETSDFEVTFGYLERYLNDPHCSMEIYSFDSLTEAKRTDMVQHAINLYFGSVYGYLQLISLGIRRLLGRIGIKIKNFFRQGVVCCGVPMSALSITTILPFTNMDPESKDTQEFYEMIKTSSAKLVYSQEKS
jgi:hypothetical protein